MDSVARPLLRVPLPREVDPSLNVTMPVAAKGETVAVKVTDCPKVDGLRLDASAVVVGVSVPPPVHVVVPASVTAAEALSNPQP